MAVNSYKQDEHSTDVGKMKTLMRLFAYLLDYKKEILAVLAIRAFCDVCQSRKPSDHGKTPSTNIFPPAIFPDWQN